MPESRLGVAEAPLRHSLEIGHDYFSITPLTRLALLTTLSLGLSAIAFGDGGRGEGALRKDAL